MKPGEVWIGLGANLGEPVRQLNAALGALRELPGMSVEAVSRWHRTAPVGGPKGQPDYWNGALVGTWRGEALELLDATQTIERAFGRDRTREPRHGPRTLDLDLLAFSGLGYAHERLVLPHPGLEERLFVLVPLAEIAPWGRLPRCGRTVAERLEELRAREAAGSLR